jgi:hypothetical protein
MGVVEAPASSSIVNVCGRKTGIVEAGHTMRAEASLARRQFAAMTLDMTLQTARQVNYKRLSTAMNSHQYFCLSP